MYLIGIEPTELRTSTEGPTHTLGTLATSEPVGKVYQYVQADEALTAGMCVIIHEDGGTEGADVTSTAPGTGAGLPAGLAVSGIAQNGFGWIQRLGVGDVALNLADDAAAHTNLNSTATGGTLDDDATAGAEVIFGITATATAVANKGACILNWPRVGTTVPAP
jgi:hypothetical protein